MFMVIPTWEVRIKKQGIKFRVPSTNLDAFIKVMTFNNLEFDVKKEKGTQTQSPEFVGVEEHGFFN